MPTLTFESVKLTLLLVLIDEYIAQTDDGEEEEWYATDRTFARRVFKGWHSNFVAFLPWLKTRLAKLECDAELYHEASENIASRTSKELGGYG